MTSIYILMVTLFSLLRFVMLVLHVWVTGPYCSGLVLMIFFKAVFYFMVKIVCYSLTVVMVLVWHRVILISSCLGHWFTHNVVVWYSWNLFYFLKLLVNGENSMLFIENGNGVGVTWCYLYFFMLPDIDIGFYLWFLFLSLSCV